MERNNEHPVKLMRGDLDSVTSAQRGDQWRHRIRVPYDEHDARRDGKDAIAVRHGVSARAAPPAPRKRVPPVAGPSPESDAARS